MPTATDNRPDEDQDRIQQHYNDQFDTLNSAEQQAESGVPNDRDDSEESGFFRDETAGAGGDSPESDKGRRVKHDDPVDPDDGLFSDDETKGKRSRFSISRRKGVTGGIVGLLLGGGVFFGFGIASGPLQVIHLGEVLHHGFSKSDSDSSNRTRHLFRYARAAKSGNIGETRVGILGSKVFGKTLSQLHEIGIDIETGRSGQPTRTKINTDKLKENFPELEGMSNDEKKAFIGEKLGVSPESIGGGGASFSVEQSDMNIRSTRLLAQNSVGLLDDGKIVGGIKSRVLTKVFNLPSLFHPIKKLQAGLTKKYINNKLVTETEQQQAADEEAASQKALVEAAAGDGAAPQIEEAKGNLSGVGANVNRALTFTGFACQIQGIANDIAAIDRARVVLPAVAAATSVMAAGSQTKSGKDISLVQLGALVSTFTDKKGRTIWGSKPLQVLAGGTGVGLKDIDGGQKQAFGSHNTVNSVNEVVDKGTLGHPGVACSTLSQVVQGVAVIGIAGIEEIGSAGTATGAVILEFAGKQAAQFVVAAAAMHLINGIITDNASVDALSKDAFKGLSGGGLYAYGIRAAGNTTAIGTGGVALGNNESTLFAAQAAKEDKQEFESKSMFARMFDASDYRSLTGRLADSISPSAGQNLVGVASGLTHMASSITGLFGIFTPHAAADGSSYDWGFSQYGIPNKLLDDPRLSDPYNNASLVAKRLDSECKDATGALNAGCDVITNVKICFGADINLQTDPATNAAAWDVVTTAGTKGVDPESDEYRSKNCDDLSDENWNRMIMWVFDTNTMKAAACYQGDEQSCQDIGAAASASGGGSQFNIATYNILHSVDSPGGNGASDWKKRAIATTDNIKANSMDIVGTQEMQENQFNEFRKDLSGYETYPKTFKKGSNNTIFWDTSKFSFVAGDTFVVPYYDDSDSSYPDHLTGQGTSPEVELRDNTTGQTFWVLNTHLPAYFRAPSDGGGAIKREQGSKILLAEAKKLSADGSPVFITGDLNSATKIRAGNRDTDIHGDRSRIPYCVLTKDGTLMNTVDIMKNRTGACPSTGSDIKIDQVYATPTNVTVSSAKLLAGSMAQTGTDHAGPVMAAVTIGGGAEDTNSTVSLPSLNSLKNFRDAGASTNGQLIAPGKLLRSATLSKLSTGDAHTLSLLLGQNGKIINLTSTKDVAVPGVQDISYPIPATLDYTEFVDNKVDRDAFGKTIKAIANANGTVLVHCTAGKDRTGWLVAMVMHSLGASNAQIMKEYLLSNPAPPAKQVVTQTMLNAGLKEAEKKYGSVDKYITNGLGIDSATLTKLTKVLGP